MSRDEITDATASERDQFPEDFLNGVTTSSMPQHRLALKVGSVVICLRNVAPDQGLCNGSRAVVVVNGKSKCRIGYFKKCLLRLSICSKTAWCLSELLFSLPFDFSGFVEASCRSSESESLQVR